MPTTSFRVYASMPPPRSQLIGSRKASWPSTTANGYASVPRRRRDCAVLRRSSLLRWVPSELPRMRDANHVREHHGEGPWGADAEPDRIEVRFELADRDDTIAFAKELSDAGYEAHRRGSFVFLFAEDHESAHALGEQLRGKAPAGAQLFYMGEGRVA